MSKLTHTQKRTVNYFKFCEFLITEMIGTSMYLSVEFQNFDCAKTLSYSLCFLTKSFFFFSNKKNLNILANLQRFLFIKAKKFTALQFFISQ